MDKIDRDKVENDQQREYHDELQDERKARGDARTSYLEAGRERALIENAQRRERNSSQPQPTEEVAKSQE